MAPKAAQILDRIALRTARDPPALNQACCLRCSKRIHLWSSEDDCERLPSGEKKCGYCARKHHECLNIPNIFHARVNSLLERKQELVVLEAAGVNLPAGARQELAEAVVAYEKEVEAHLRAVGKQHAAKELEDSMDAHAKVFASLLGRLVETQEQLLDIRRAEVGLPPRTTRAEGASRPRAAFGVDLPSLPIEGEENDEMEVEDEGEGGEGA